MTFQARCDDDCRRVDRDSTLRVVPAAGRRLHAASEDPEVAGQRPALPPPRQEHPAKGRH